MHVAATRTLPNLRHFSPPNRLQTAPCACAASSAAPLNTSLHAAHTPPCLPHPLFLVSWQVVHAGASMLCMPNSVVREVDRDVC
jgi:hypothetical protein